jgi:hypothetical protein
MSHACPQPACTYAASSRLPADEAKRALHHHAKAVHPQPPQEYARDGNGHKIMCNNSHWTCGMAIRLHKLTAWPNGAAVCYKCYWP